MISQQSIESKRYKNETENSAYFYEVIPSVMKRLLYSCNTDNNFVHMDSKPIPHQESVIQIINQVRRILFPGYFNRSRINLVNLEYGLGRETEELFEGLSKQIALSFQHDCLRYDQPCSQCIKRSRKKTSHFIEILPDLKTVLITDIHAAVEGDPAAKSYDEVIYCYPGFFAITVYRMAHELIKLDVPFLPRMMTEHAHSFTGIDIHPGAEIGESFFIDHGTGVVVGETTKIGNRVRLYQGVTLGALSLPRDAGNRFRNKKRHPTVEDDVIIYSNATILGGETIIGSRSIIGGNVWITESVPPDTKVILKKPELIYIGNNTKKTILLKKGGGK